MRSWDNVEHRREATLAFANYMHDPAHAELRKKCCDDPAEAKRQFALIGEFYLEGEQLPNQMANTENLQPIPQRVEFRAYEATDPRRHDLVVLVIPSVTGKPSDEPSDIWIAAWPSWTA